MELREFIPPVPVDFYMECLKNDDNETYQRTKVVIANIAEKLGGRPGQVYLENAMPAIEMGLMRPQFNDLPGGAFNFYFEMWSFWDGCFKKVSYMEPSESKFTNELILYHARRN